MVREIDALGGVMGEGDRCHRNPVQAAEPQSGRGGALAAGAGGQAPLRRLGGGSAAPGRTNRVGCRAGVGRLTVRRDRVTGVELETTAGAAGGERLDAQAVVVTTGTFLNGLVHVGSKRTPAGRSGEPPSRHLAESLKALGLPWGRLKTGTPPRLHRRSIRFDRLEKAHGDERPVPFSFMTGGIDREQIECHQMHTTARVHDIVRANIHRSPLYNGQIEGIGPRYCPSLEDKVMRFPHHERHHIFLEPEGGRRRRGLRQRVLDEPAGGRPGIARAGPPGARRRGDDAAGLRGGVRLRATDGVVAELRGEERGRALPGGAGERNLGVRGGGRAGNHGRNQRGSRRGGGRSRSCSVGRRPIWECWPTT